MPSASDRADGDGLAELSVDELARRAGLPVRTIREYQTMSLLPAPQKRGRVGVYAGSHLVRLQLIGRLQGRGYSLAGIRDLLASWSDGADLGEVLGLAPDQLVHVDEPGAPATLEQLTKVLPGVVPEHLDALLGTGVVEPYGHGGYCVPSPSLLQLAADVLAAGYPAATVIDLFAAIGRAADEVADAVVATLAARPAEVDDRRFANLVNRGRGLLAHGTGRLTIQALGRRLGVGDHDSLADALAHLPERKAT